MSKKRTKSKSRTKIIWLVSVAIVFVVATIIAIIIFINRPTKLSDAYNKCRKVEGDITIFFKPGTPKSTLESMATTMRADKNVKNIEITTSEDEYQKFLASRQDDQEMSNMLVELEDLMLSKMQAVMRIKIYDVGDFSNIKYIVNNNEEFKENLDESYEPIYPEVGAFELLDNGKTLLIEGYTRMECICSALNMPDKLEETINSVFIEDSGGTITISERKRYDEWDDLEIEWFFKSETLRVVIRQK